MSDRRAILIAALLLAPHLAGAQEVEEWRRRFAEQSRRTAIAMERYKNYGGDTVIYDRVVRVDDLAVAFVAGDLSARDTAAIAEGLTQARERLRARHGDAGLALLASGGRWTAMHVPNDRRRLWRRVTLQRAGDWTSRTYIDSPIAASDIEQAVYAFAGEKLTQRNAALHGFSGYAALQPERVHYEEVARRLATSWAGSVRRCAAGALDACATVLAPFDAGGDPTRYFDPADFRQVVSVARLPAVGDSLYFAARRRCLAGEDSVCVRVIERVALPDPLNDQVRGTLLAHAIELGGPGAVARAAAAGDLPALETLGLIAGVTPDSLLGSWRQRVFDALDEERGATGVPLLLSSAAWGALLFLASRRRRYL